MAEKEVIDAIKSLITEISLLRQDIATLQESLQVIREEDVSVPPWLAYEIMEALASQETPMSTEEIANVVNEGRVARGEKREKSSQASVSRSVSGLVKDGFVVQEQVGRRVYYRLSNRTKVVRAEGKDLKQTANSLTEKVTKINGKRYSKFMMSVVAPEHLKDVDSLSSKWIADQVFADEKKPGSISFRTRTFTAPKAEKVEITLLLLP